MNDHDLIIEAATYGYDSADIASGDFDWKDVEARERTLDKSNDKKKGLSGLKELNKLKNLKLKNLKEQRKENDPEWW